MPTNILRKSVRTPGSATRGGPAAGGDRMAVIHAGRVTIRVRLLATATADRIWSMLPLHSTAETWGAAIHFETPVETGRERTARINVAPGDICYWTEDDRVLIAFGPTPISRPGEIRLMSPCNIWAAAIDDVAALAAVTPGEKVVVERARPEAP